MYPLNMNIKENMLDRINIDRRFHISPPGQTTKYKITEFYETSIDEDSGSKIIQKIISSDPEGDILS